MTAPTHIAFAELIYLLLLTTTGVAVNGVNAATVGLSSLLADIDTESSTLGRLLPSASLPIERRFGHRTLTHSACFVAGLAVAALPVWAASRDLYLCLIAGYATHPFLDTMNVSGVQLFYPFTAVRCVFPFDVNSPTRFRTATGSRMDRALGLIFLAACIPTFLISEQGHERFIRVTQRNIESAVRDYNEFSMTHRVFAELSGHNLFTKELVRGRYEIVGALDARTLLFRDTAGILHSLGREHEAEVTAEWVVCSRGEPARTLVNDVLMENQPLGSLADALEEGESTYVFGELLAREPLEVGSSTPAFSPVTGSGHRLELRYATADDLKRPDLARIFVVQGRFNLRSTVPAEQFSGRAPLLRDSLGAFAVSVLRYAIGAAVEMHVMPGDTVGPGQILAEARPDTLEMLKGELEEAQRAAIADRRQAEVAALEMRLGELQEALRADSAQLLGVRKLCEKGFASIATLLEAEQKLQETLARRRILQHRKDILVRRLAISAREDTFNSPGGSVRRTLILRSEVSGVVHDVRKSAKGHRVELTVIVRKRSW